jgi:hypothetical protein
VLFSVMVWNEPQRAASQRRRASIAHFAGLDVSVAETSICIVDDHGKIVRKRKVPTEPEAIIEALNGFGRACERIGLEAGTAVTVALQ